MSWQPLGSGRHRKNMDSAAFPSMIGLHGASGAGRATIAAHLCSQYDFRSYSLADPVRQALYAMDPLLSAQESLRSLVDVGGWTKAVTDRIHGPEVNRLLDVMRTVVAREVFGPDVWLQRFAASEAVQAELLGPAPVVLTDVTTPEEARWVLAAGGAVWRVARPGFEPAAPLSEDLVTCVVTNDATELALTRRVDRAVAAQHAQLTDSAHAA